jgi:hypothetical protein
MTTANLQTTGFGVFAYNTGASDYGATGYSTMATTGETPNWTPNFMWNQQVTYSSGWVYTPLKYWPNGIDTNGASQATVQKLSFFAYAPYVASGSGETGITALSANNVNGDPKVTYALSGSGNDVDLLWGTTSTNGATVGGVAQAGVGSDLKVSETSVANLNENLTKMNTSGKVGFNFKHALAKIKDVQVKVDPDNVNIETDANERPLTKITVSNITITSTNFTDNNKSEGEGKKSTKGGVFNLATGIWNLTETDAAQSSTEQITSTGDSGAHNVLNADIIDPATVNAANIFGESPASGITGVTTNYVTAYNSTNRRPLMLMPGTYPRFTVAITYTVRTEDANLAAGYSETTQTITKTVDFADPVLLNKQYTLKLRLGLTSIKVDAEVAEWVADGEQVITLPVNVNPVEP